MKNITNTQGSVWLAILVIVAVVVAALLLSGDANFLNKDQSVHGLVSEINHEEQYFILTEIEVLSVADDGAAETQETNYVVTWTGDVAIQQYHPSVLNGGEMVLVTLREPLKNDDLTIVDPESIEVTRGNNNAESYLIIDPERVVEDDNQPEEAGTTTSN